MFYQRHDGLIQDGHSLACFSLQTALYPWNKLKLTRGLSSGNHSEQVGQKHRDRLKQGRDKYPCYEGSAGTWYNVYRDLVFTFGGRRMDEWMAGDSESQTEEKPMIIERKGSCLTLLLQQVNSVGLYSLPLLS